jgi:hypothetical protein
LQENKATDQLSCKASPVIHPGVVGVLTLVSWSVA